MLLNEYEIAEQILSGKKPKKHNDLFIVAKYLRHEGGCNEEETFSMLNSIMSSMKKNYIPSKYVKNLMKLAKKGSEYELIVIDSINITQKELAKIKTINNSKQERLLFSLLVHAKFHNAISKDNNNWCNVPIGELFKTAKVSARNCREKGKHLNKLKNDGFIVLSRKNTNLNIKCEFVDEGNDKNGIVISDIRELGYQYINLTDSRQFTFCQKCGVIIKKQSMNDHTTKYCSSCLNEQIVVQKRNSFQKLE